MCLDMTAIGQSLGDDVCKALPGMHALTGCDSTREFVGKGKMQAFRLVVESHPNMCAAIMSSIYGRFNRHLQRHVKR